MVKRIKKERSRFSKKVKILIAAAVLAFVIIGALTVLKKETAYQGSQELGLNDRARQPYRGAESSACGVAEFEDSERACRILCQGRDPWS